MKILKYLIQNTSIEKINYKDRNLSKFQDNDKTMNNLGYRNIVLKIWQRWWRLFSSRIFYLDTKFATTIARKFTRYLGYNQISSNTQRSKSQAWCKLRRQHNTSGDCSQEKNRSRSRKGDGVFIMREVSGNLEGVKRKIYCSEIQSWPQRK